MLNSQFDVRPSELNPDRIKWHRKVGGNELKTKEAQWIIRFLSQEDRWLPFTIRHVNSFRKEYLKVNFCQVPEKDLTFEGLLGWPDDAWYSRSEPLIITFCGHMFEVTDDFVKACKNAVKPPHPIKKKLGKLRKAKV